VWGLWRRELIPDGLHDAERMPAARMFLDPHVAKSGRPALRRKRLRLLFGPPVAGQPGGAGTHAPFDRQQPSPRGEYPPGFGKSDANVFPMVHGRHAPQHSRRRVRLPEVFRSALGPRDPGLLAGQHLSQSQHDGRRINAYRPCSTASGFSDGGTWAATDVDNAVCRRYRCEVSGEARDRAPSGDHDESGQQPSQPGEAWMVGVMVDSGHQPSLQVHARSTS
jgi:hypothetical protein